MIPFVASLIMLLILGYIGIHVLKREVIFIDIALAQIAAVGTIAAHVAFHLHANTVLSHAMALGTTLLAAAFFAAVRRRIVQVPLEAVIGVSYAIAAAAALFLVGVAPGGHVHIQEMLAGSILWASWSDVLWSAVVFAVVGACFFAFRRPFGAISEDYDGAVAAGLNTAAWDFLFYALVAVVITVAVRIAGVVLVFTFLIIPATLSASFAAGWAGRLFAAWIGGALSAALGLLFADRFDFSVGPSIALFLGTTLIVAASLRRANVNRAATATAWVVVAAVIGVWFASGVEADDTGVTGGGVAPVATMTHSHSHPDELASDPDGGEVAAVYDRDRVEAMADIDSLQAAYQAVTDDDLRSAIVRRALRVERGAGIHMALDYLSLDPPLLFRAEVVDDLAAVTGSDTGYDIDASFNAPQNQDAASALAAEARSR
jgi:zinc/manganese transport system permease protein